MAISDFKIFKATLVRSNYINAQYRLEQNVLIKKIFKAILSSSIYVLNKIGDITPPCFTPLKSTIIKRNSYICNFTALTDQFSFEVPLNNQSISICGAFIYGFTTIILCNNLSKSRAYCIDCRDKLVVGFLWFIMKQENDLLITDHYPR